VQHGRARTSQPATRLVTTFYTYPEPTPNTLEQDEFGQSRSGINGPLSPHRRSRKAREVRFHLVEDEQDVLRREV
jgi:hypothetical protein